MGIARACVLRSQQPPGPLSCGERAVLSSGAPEAGQAQSPARSRAREGEGSTHRVAGHGAGTPEEPCGERAALTAPGPARIHPPDTPGTSPGCYRPDTAPSRHPLTGLCPLLGHPDGRCPIPASPDQLPSAPSCAASPPCLRMAGAHPGARYRSGFPSPGRDRPGHGTSPFPTSPAPAAIPSPPVPSRQCPGAVRGTGHEDGQQQQERQRPRHVAN